MAIEKMKKLRLVTVRSKKNDLLHELMKCGCVEVSEIDNQIQESEMEQYLTQESGRIMDFKSKQTVLDQALGLLNKYAPAKGKLLAPKPEFEKEVLLDDSEMESAIQIADTIINAENQIKRDVAEESRQLGIIESLKPWEDLDIPLEYEGTESCSVVLGSLSARANLQTVESVIHEVSEEAELIRVSQDKSQHYVVLICLKEAYAAIQECLRDYSFTVYSANGMVGLPKACIAEAQNEIAALQKDREDQLAFLAESGKNREALKLAYDRAENFIFMAQAEERLYGTENTVVMQGWFLADREEELEEIFERFGCAWETEQPEEEEYTDVPVRLKNNKFTNSMNMVTNMYSLPMYGTVDPNPLMAPFFILFFGLMMADMGYGILMIAAALVAFKKMQPKDGAQVFVQLLLYCGISTFLCGVLTGGFFSDILYQLVHIINPESTWGGLWCLFSPENDSTLVLYGSFVLGFLHLCAGMGVNFYKKTKAGDLAGAIWEEGALWVLFIGALLAFLKIGTIAGVPVVLVIGLVMLLFGAGREAKGFGKVTAAFGCIYNTATGWFGDVLSYSRIMALMLAGGVVGKVFNTVAVMPMKSAGINVVTVIAFILIFVLGHAMNFALNLLGCFVHDLRLQCLEFFGKFYEDGGKPFKPLSVTGKFARAKND